MPIRARQVLQQPAQAVLKRLPRLQEGRLWATSQHSTERTLIEVLHSDVMSVSAKAALLHVLAVAIGKSMAIPSTPAIASVVERVHTADIIIHFDAATVLPLLLNDVYYRNGFEVGHRGAIGRLPTEKRLFGIAYNDCDPHDRVKYGVSIVVFSKVCVFPRYQRFGLISDFPCFASISA